MSPVAGSTNSTIPAQIELRGAWQGATHDPARHFSGEVLSSAHPALAPGQRVEVLFHHSGDRASGADDHGRYLLRVNGREVNLISFICPATATTGPRGHDDTQPATWLAVPVPE